MHSIGFLWLCGLLTSCATSGSSDDAQLVIATFNVEWLGDGVHDHVERSDQDYLRIADIMLKTGADVIAVQEVENLDALAKVLRYMQGYSGVVSQAGGKQRVGLAYRNDVAVTVRGDYTPLQLDRPERLRPGLLVECKKRHYQWQMLSVHLKSTSRHDSTPALIEESRRLRSQQVAVLNKFIDSVLAAGTESDILICGDFNDYPGRRTNGTLDELEKGAGVFLTSGLKSCANPRWNSIDHIVASPMVAKRMIQGSQRVENHRLFLTENESKKVSDHCAVVVQLNLSAPDPDAQRK